MPSRITAVEPGLDDPGRRELEQRTSGRRGSIVAATCAAVRARRSARAARAGARSYGLAERLLLEDRLDAAPRAAPPVRRRSRAALRARDAPRRRRPPRAPARAPARARAARRGRRPPTSSACVPSLDDAGPSSSTTIWSASRTAETRDATTTTVRPAEHLGEARAGSPPRSPRRRSRACRRGSGCSAGARARARARCAGAARPRASRRARRRSCRSRPGRSATSFASCARSRRLARRARGSVVGEAVRDVVGERHREQERVLRAPSRCASAACASGMRFTSTPSRKSCAVRHLVEARDQRGERGLARADRPDDAEHAAGRHAQRRRRAARARGPARRSGT